MAKIEFSPEAIADLKQTKQYIANELCNDAAAVRTLAKIMKHIRTLKRFPKSGSPLSSIINLETDYRFLVCENHTAFYRIENETVYILRVLHSRRNFMRILFE